MLYSIIIPIYNAQFTLPRCLQSIRDLSIDNYEVIMVDDGSRDRSSQICDEFVQKDSRFRVFHQENKGVSTARNNGMKRAVGDYICFIDSDDYVACNYLEQLNETIGNDRADVLFIGYHKVKQTGNIVGTYLPPIELRGTDLLMKLSDLDMFGYTWIKCFSREIIADSLFSEEMSLFEDEVFACSVLERAKKIDVVPHPLYNYVIGGKDMLTERIHNDYCTLSDKVYLAWKQLLSQTENSRVFLEHKANLFVERCKYYGFERDVEQKSFFEELAETCFFQEHTNWNRLDRQIQAGNWLPVKSEIIKYRLKNKLLHKNR